MPIYNNTILYVTARFKMPVALFLWSGVVVLVVQGKAFHTVGHMSET
jgi:hypothetical protein